jgi:hypothetical protein
MRQHREQQQGHDIGDLDHRVDGRAGGVLVGIADGVAGDGGLVGFRFADRQRKEAIRRGNTRLGTSASTRSFMANTYNYNGLTNLTPGRLFFWVLMDTTKDHFGLTDVAALVAIVIGQPIIPIRGKFGGAPPGTSIASIAARTALNVELRFRLPMLTGASVRTLKIVFTRNLGAFVGRTIPIVGEVMLTVDATQIMWKTISTYNSLVKPEDQLL